MDGCELLVRVWPQPGHVLVTMAGEIDIATAPQLRGRLGPLAAGGRPVIVDLTEVTFIDAAGLRVLAGAARQAVGGGSLHVVAARYQVRRIFALTGLDRHIPLARSLAGALASCAPATTSAPMGNSRKPAHRAPGRDRRA